MNILCAVDHITDAKIAAKMLSVCSIPQDSRVYVLHVLDEELIVESERQDGKQIERKQRPELRTRPIVFPAHIPSRAELEAQAKSLLEDAAEHLRTKIPYPVEPVFRTGVPGAEILQAIDELNIHLVMVGAHKHTQQEMFMLSSVSDWILTEAPCPVGVLRPPAQGHDNSTLKELLIAVDGSADAWAAMEFIKQLGLPSHIHLTIFHVIKQHLPDGPLRFSTREISREDFINTIEQTFGPRGKEAITLLEKAAATVQEGERHIDLELAFGQEAEEIIQRAKTIQADLLVVGSRGLTGLRRAGLMGSVSNRVARHAPCSVLVVR